MISVCKCCGHPIPPSSVEAALTPMERQLYTYVKRAGTVGITNRDLMDLLYANDPSGGPESSNIISVVTKNIRKKINPLGLTIKSTGGPGSRYYLNVV